MSYEQIAATLTRHGLKTSPAGVGAFCRRTFAKAEILREQPPPADGDSQQAGRDRSELPWALRGRAAGAGTAAAGPPGTEDRPGQLLTGRRGNALIQGFPRLRALRAAHPRGRGGKAARYFLTAGARVSRVGRGAQQRPHHERPVGRDHLSRQAR